MKKYFGLTLLVAILSFVLISNELSAQKGKGGCQNKQNCSKFVDANGDDMCDNFVDTNNDGKCDNCTSNGTCIGTCKGKGMGQGKHNCGKFVDANNDGKCDNFVDTNNDGKCDNCIGNGTCSGTCKGKGMGQGKHNCGKFVDANNDGKCDNFVDANSDGKCDNCTGNGTCDGTGKAKGKCQSGSKGNCGKNCKMTNNNNTSNFTLNQNVPNPVVGNTKISFNLKAENTVKVVLSDKLGNKVKDIFEGKLSAGDHEVDLNVTGLNPGNYYYSVSVGGKVQSKQLIVIK